MREWIHRGLPVEGARDGADDGDPTAATARTGFAAWTHGWLIMQGYGGLSAEQRRAISLGLRLTTGACLAGVVAGLITRSPAIFLILAAVAAVAGLTPRHPFDAIWQYGVRHLVRGPALPPNPPQRRRPFLLAAPWLLGLGILYAAGADTWGVVLGLPFVASCTLVTATHYCLPSRLLAMFSRSRQEPVPRAHDART
jgi:hypothetical protein